MNGSNWKDQVSKETLNSMFNTLFVRSILFCPNFLLIVLKRWTKLIQKFPHLVGKEKEVQILTRYFLENSYKKANSQEDFYEKINNIARGSMWSSLQNFESYYTSYVASLNAQHRSTQNIQPQQPQPSIVKQEQHISPQQKTTPSPPKDAKSSPSNAAPAKASPSNTVQPPIAAVPTSPLVAEFWSIVEALEISILKTAAAEFQDSIKHCSMQPNMAKQLDSEKRKLDAVKKLLEWKQLDAVQRNKLQEHQLKGYMDFIKTLFKRQEKKKAEMKALNSTPATPNAEENGTTAVSSTISTSTPFDKQLYEKLFENYVAALQHSVANTSVEQLTHLESIFEHVLYGPKSIYKWPDSQPISQHFIHSEAPILIQQFQQHLKQLQPPPKTEQPSQQVPNKSHSTALGYSLVKLSSREKVESTHLDELLQHCYLDNQIDTYHKHVMEVYQQADKYQYIDNSIDSSNRQLYILVLNKKFILVELLNQSQSQVLSLQTNEVMIPLQKALQWYRVRVSTMQRIMEQEWKQVVSEMKENVQLASEWYQQSHHLNRLHLQVQLQLYQTIAFPCLHLMILLLENNSYTVESIYFTQNASFIVMDVTMMNLMNQLQMEFVDLKRESKTVFIKQILDSFISNALQYSSTQLLSNN